MTDLIGLRIGGRYRLARRLKRGRGAELYLAERRERTYALKLLDPGVRPTATSLQHPYVVRVHEVGFDRTLERHYVVMDLVEGHPLGHLLRAGPLEPLRALRLVGQLLSALEAAHALELVHGHLSPSKILVLGAGAPEEELRLFGFGLGSEVQLSQPVAADFETQLEALRRRVARRGLHTQTRLRPLRRPPPVQRRAEGALLYASPEVICERPYDARADLYSAGALLFELLTGSPPHRPDPQAADQEADLRLAIEGRQPPRLLELRPELPPELGEVLSRALSKAPGDRPADARALAHELRRAQRKVPVSLAPPAAPPLPPPALGAGPVLSITPTSLGTKGQKLVIRPQDLGEPTPWPVQVMLVAGAILLVLGLFLALQLRRHEDPFRAPGRQRDRVAWANSASVSLLPPPVTWTSEEHVYQGVRDGSRLVWVQRGGAPVTSGTRPDGIFLGRYEVTWAQYQRYCAAVGMNVPVHDTSELAPVTSLTLSEAQAYCRWANGRLPRLAELESIAPVISPLPEPSALREVWAGGAGPVGVPLDLRDNADEWTSDGHVLEAGGVTRPDPSSRDPRRGFRLAIEHREE